MADSKSSWDDKIPPGGKVFVALAGVGAGIWALMTFLGMGIEAFGMAKRHFPEVVMGIITLGFAIAAIVIFNKKDPPG